MRRLLVFLLCAATLFAQTNPTDPNGGQMAKIPVQTVPNQPFAVGYGRTVSQDLGVTPSQLQADPANPGYFLDGVYKLSFSVVNFYPTYPGDYEVEIDFGSQKLCEFYAWDIRRSAEVSIPCTSPSYLVVDGALPGNNLPAQGSNDLVVHFTTNVWSIVFNHVSLTFTPTN